MPGHDQRLRPCTALGEAAVGEQDIEARHAVIVAEAVPRAVCQTRTEVCFWCLARMQRFCSAVTLGYEFDYGRERARVAREFCQSGSHGSLDIGGPSSRTVYTKFTRKRDAPLPLV